MKNKPFIKMSDQPQASGMPRKLYSVSFDREPMGTFEAFTAEHALRMCMRAYATKHGEQALVDKLEQLEQKEGDHRALIAVREVNA